MPNQAELLSVFIDAIQETITAHADEVAEWIVLLVTVIM